jgi:cytochrome d ubiquinol oxidase subunit I
MSTLMLARWQFASTTVFHYLIVPLTIGLALTVAGMQTAAYRSKDPTRRAHWDRAGRFYGKLMMVSFAIGVVTGIVQEFQFGMAWSEYSRFVGDVFGAPLAMEGLVAFFLESTFLGVWIFGRDHLSAKVHLVSIWLLALGTMLSAFFILAANSWMQHPVGWTYDPAKGSARLTDIWAVLTQKTQLVTFPHTILAAVLTGSCVVIGVSAWHLRRHGSAADGVHAQVLPWAAGIALVAAIGTSVAGHVEGQVMTQQQPMKMAAAEALWNTTDHAGFSLFAYGDVAKGRNKVDVTIPDGLSLLATNHVGGTVQGVNQIEAAEVARFGPGSYIPVVWIAYWMFRLMIGFGALAGLMGLVLLVQWRRRRLTASPRLLRLCVIGALLPFLANSSGWIFTETARQPWLVYGVLTTKAGVSPGVGPASLLTTLIAFTLLYAALGVVAARLFLRFARQGPDPVTTPVPTGPAHDLDQLLLAG